MGLYEHGLTDFTLLNNPDSGVAGFGFDSLDGHFKILKSDGTVVDLEALSGVRNVINETSGFTPSSSEKNAIYDYTGNGVSTATLDVNLPVGWFAEFVNRNSGSLIFEAGVGATIDTPDPTNTTLAQKYSKAFVYKADATTFVLLGDLSTSDIPLQLAGLKAWYDFSDTSYVTFSTGNFVETLIDRSDSAQNVTQSTALQQAEFIPGGQNGLGSLRFTGGQRYLLSPTLSDLMSTDVDFTLFVVSKQNTSSNSGVVHVDRTTGQQGTGITYNSGSNEVRFYMKGNNSINGSLPSRSTLASLALRRNGVSGSAFILGNEINLNIGSNSVVSAAYLGAYDDTGTGSLNGEVCEVLIYNRALNKQHLLRNYFRY
jgi:hypothetical protein